MPTQSDLLIFDCDGVLVDSEQLAFDTFISVLNQAGVPVTAAMVERCFGMKQADLLVKIAELTGCSIPDHVTETLWPATRASFERALRPMPGIFDVLDSTRGIKRCVASSSNPERIALSLELAGLSSYFGDATFSSHQVARGKPAPDLFLFAAARMDVDPARCTVIEDSTYGVRGAVAAGMRAIGFVGGSHSFPGHAEDLRRAGAAFVESTWAVLGPRLLD
jgi:HAD superfamily hydrolase (TIGR01509 family)